MSDLFSDEPSKEELDVIAAQEFAEGCQYDFFKPHATVGISNWLPSLARQEFAEECDINVIMSRYEKTGQLPVNGAEPIYMDALNVPSDFREAMDQMIEAEKAFMMLPARVRREFENDPRAFVDFASDPENVEQLRQWGLARPTELADAGGGGAQPPSAEKNEPPSAAPSTPAKP